MEEKIQYTISIYSENNVGLLNRVSAIFLKRHKFKTYINFIYFLYRSLKSILSYLIKIPLSVFYIFQNKTLKNNLIANRASRKHISSIKKFSKGSREEKERQREFTMYVSKPGIALITPKREVGLVRVAYDNSDSPVVPLAAATYNQGENVTLSLTAGTAGNLAGSGLTFESITGVGTVEGGLEGSPASLAEDTDFTITVKAVETGEPSYNSERTLTITILQDPDYYSPAS